MSPRPDAATTTTFQAALPGEHTMRTSGPDVAATQVAATAPEPTTTMNSGEAR
ncbi:hypothetical protein [Nonomuraea rhizosphaerae]|uniref:hypothetical protein n=1 Tax=Nonomuraea rhizosphaerae TaxID=2665663 RepID=UPI001C5FEAFB|nr:hypothetical protein [Nonomuraea rhizosphaerae]